MKKTMLTCVSLLMFCKALSFLNLSADVLQPIEKKRAYIEQVLSDGAILVLTDESEWVVHPGDRIFASMWLSPAFVTIEPLCDPEGEYTFLMRNNWTKKSIRVHFIGDAKDL